MEKRIWRANVGRRTVVTEAVRPEWERLGGRGLVARILLDEVPPTCQALGAYNKLVWTAGLLAGYRLSSCDRVSVGAKSPLTGGIKESNAGGTTGLALVRLGVHALIVEGQPEGNDWWILRLGAAGGSFEPAGDVAGLGVYEAAQRLIARYGRSAAFAIIGPGGERRLSGAGVFNLDKDGEPSRANGRGGMGAVMGAKHLKAVVIDPGKGELPSPLREEPFAAAKKDYLRELMAHPQTKTYADYGTAALVMMTDTFGGFPTRNFSTGHFEGAEKISGEALRDRLLARGKPSETTHACMAGCVIRCSNIVADEQGKKIVAPLEYETIALTGSNLGLDDLDLISRLNWEMNDIGLDTIDTGAALGVAGEAGYLRFGDADSVFALINEIRQGTALGRILASGAATTGRVLGVARVPAVKGQAMAAYDPRAIKGTGVTYATSPQGADHTAGLTIRAQVNHRDPSVQGELSRKSQINNAGYDTLGVCLFASFGFAKVPGAIPEMLRACYGGEVSDDALQQLGRETLRMEKTFNRAAGFGPAHDRIPHWMTKEPLPPTGSVFDVTEEDLDKTADW